MFNLNQNKLNDLKKQLSETPPFKMGMRSYLQQKIKELEDQIRIESSSSHLSESKREKEIRYAVFADWNPDELHANHPSKHVVRQKVKREECKSIKL